MKRVTAIAVAGAIILSISGYLALSRFLAPTSSIVAPVTRAPSYAAPSMTVEAPPPSEAMEFEAFLAEFGSSRRQPRRLPLTLRRLPRRPPQRRPCLSNRRSRP